MSIPNFLTLFRIVAIPFVISAWEYSAFHIAWILLILSLITDFLDGKLARLLHQESHFGAIFDPIADKFLVISYTCYFGIAMGYLPFWLCIIYLARNISQLLAIPILSWWLKKTFYVKPKWQPKWAGLLCFSLVPFSLLLAPGALLFDQPNFVPIWQGLLIVSAALEIYVLVTYIPRLIEISIGRKDTFE